MLCVRLKSEAGNVTRGVRCRTPRAKQLKKAAFMAAFLLISKISKLYR